MRLITDWHIHSKYSRACSRDLVLPSIAEACQRKGIDIVATGDWTHPAWFEHLRDTLIESESGIYRVKESPTRFMLVTEVSQIYKHGGKTRRVHNLIFSPSLETCAKVNAELDRRGLNRKSDGRPILGLDSEELYTTLKSIDERIIVVPAHAWTPWYSVFGSKSGFDSLEECFGEMTKYIYAIETGLSSDPRMNWQCSMLDSVVLISNSDAHSTDKLGREANVFDLDDPSYDAFVHILQEQDRTKFLYTIEFFPEEGKYHEDGHRACKYWCEPEQTKRMKGTCPQCGKQLTIGVLHRVMDLADRPPHPERPPGAVPFRSIVPLAEIVASVVGTAPSSKKVTREVDALLREGTNEFSILLDVLSSDLYRLTTADIAEAILAVRRGDVQIDPGYDGEFGTIKPKSARKQIVQAGMF